MVIGGDPERSVVDHHSDGEIRGKPLLVPVPDTMSYPCGSAVAATAVWSQLESWTTVSSAAARLLASFCWATSAAIRQRAVVYDSYR
jgi:hypothetical protein